MQKIAKSIADRLLALLALLVLSPIMLIAALGIKLSSKGPVFYMARRMGKDMQPLTIYKFRTMKVGADKEGAITGVKDSRIFAWGEILRKTKIDELPQLINILKGSMSIVGPRPEDIEIVNSYYTDVEKKTLDVLPGLACPGSIFNYTHGDNFIDDANPQMSYVDSFLHLKLKMDMYYLDNWSILYDVEIIIRTLYVILITTFTKKKLDYPKEYKKIHSQGIL